MQLPKAFVEMMKPLLGAEWADFVAAFRETPTRGVRVDKWSISETSQTSSPIPPAVQPHLTGPIPWMPFGFYIDQESALGRTVYHEVGAFYIQEPSAMAIARALDPQPGERILDLCAAPGGKTTAIARLQKELGQLVANEIHPARVRILAENLERMGTAAAVTNASPAELGAAWPDAFDAILVDAPCSGEGMFRKDPSALAQWSDDAPTRCAARQQDILTSAVSMLRPGGRLIYSTCTFNPMENEQIVAWLEDTFGMSVEELPDLPHWSPGRPDFADGRDSLLRTRRLWPHRARGEGHFVARLRKPEGDTRRHHLPAGIDVHPRSTHKKAASRRTSLSSNAEFETWFADVYASSEMSIQKPLLHKDIYFSDELRDLPFSGIRVLRPGTPLAKRGANRIEPLHGLALRGHPSDFVRTVAVDEQEAIRFIAGDALANPTQMKGFVVVEHAGLCLGWGKAVPGRINNLYPKGWRKTGLVELS
ncbi:methyltransferase RsmF C-terminal domain-like protein [Alicyclobacillus acidoterrestris]|uniref:RsmB/NOP family class I SAM-dependent RNA methyltransferase n=1 Tax=Alicyclobacillus acidoterrestris (strain ATCC 49025 / DSM 3922 / CIP 106132 / NCIMB 13137 / GD3B) TaxID=1356854 RepID=T0CS57_ALIAG|nr:hypothetical protein [Alicyclobacillus acidoterrestris]EPZ42282.1 hypothetical protein N007_15390 [Alicyclobacillus acidoterrestris ATCC 49025]UNO48114.1 RsmB/NOP family class I SAM-dependent RNA methyltransferase [Alicyclobacillus acidoterrestris]